MHHCRVCYRPPLLADDEDPCDDCNNYHHTTCPCRTPRLDLRRDTKINVPILSREEESSNSSSTEVVAKETTTWTTTQRDYSAGAAVLLAIWISYSTWSERRSSGPGHWKVSALRELDTLSKLLRPNEHGTLPSTLSVFPSRQGLYKKGFLFGINPTPMPFPRVFATWPDLKLTFRLGLFALFGRPEDFKRLAYVVCGSKELSERSTRQVVTARRSGILYGGSGYVMGAQAYTLLTSRVPLLNSTIMWLQMPWDAYMMFNQVAVDVGKSARLLKSMHPNNYSRALDVVNRALKPIKMNTMARLLLTSAVVSGVGVPFFMKKYFSRGDRDE